jgi:hypothetical protein
MFRYRIRVAAGRGYVGHRDAALGRRRQVDAFQARAPLLDQTELPCVHQRRVDRAHARNHHVHAIKRRADSVARARHDLVVGPQSLLQVLRRRRKCLTA